MSTFVQGAGLFYAIVFVCGLIVIVTVCTIPFGLKRALQVGAATTGIVFLACFTWHYRDLAKARALIDEGRCESEVSPDQQYVAYVCRLGFYDVLRLRNVSNAQLIAEKTYPYTDVPIVLLWSKEQLEYSDGDNTRLARIALPPSMIDRLLARVP
jgi:hypothetical protein